MPGSSRRSPLTVCDPHDRPGVLRIDSTVPLGTRWVPLNASGCPPLHLVRTLRRCIEAPNERLPDYFAALSNQTLLVIGDSVDRNNVEASCQLLGGRYTVVDRSHPAFPQPDLPTSGSFGKVPDWQLAPASTRSWPRLCRVSVLDMTLVSVFSYGMEEPGEDFFAYKDSWAPPSSFEARIQDVALPLLRNLSLSPTFVHLGDGLWNLARWGYLDDFLPHDPPRDLGSAQLQWYASRYRSAWKHLLDTFDLPFEHFSARVPHQLGIGAQSAEALKSSFQYWWSPESTGQKQAGPSKHHEYFSPSRIRDLSEVQAAVIQSMSEYTSECIHRHRWGDLLFASDIFAPGDPHPPEAATTLWLEMTLHRFLQVLT